MDKVKEKNSFEDVWRAAQPYLQKGKKKDFVLHTRCVIRAMELLLQKEQGDAKILIPAAILHDAGWSKVPVKLQKSLDKAEAKKAMQLHLKYGKAMASDILARLGYSKDRIKRISETIFAHKFQNPKGLEKRLLIDADTLTDVFCEQFYSDCNDYKLSPEALFNIRKGNTFYTENARKIFKEELENRRKEIWEETKTKRIHFKNMEEFDKHFNFKA